MIYASISIYSGWFYFKYDAIRRMIYGFLNFGNFFLQLKFK